jgi:hypothetical protein
MPTETPSIADPRAPKVSFVSLGCPKALVDSERIITRLRAEGYELTRQHEGADLVIVNTCGFLDSAQAESLAAIGDALNANGKVIVTGCMGAEPEKITKAYPDVLAVTGPQQYESVVEAVHRAVPPRHDPFLDLVPPEGIKLTPRHYAYLKISEGCNNRCTFCIIPKLRGDLVSRPAADVLREAERLVAAGVKELLVISQDTSAYGTDIKYAASSWKGREIRAKFLDLARALGEFGAWVRLHYVYPYPHVDEVIALMADGKVLPYLDVPFQHASPDVLRRMKRPAAQEQTLARIRRWREICLTGSTRPSSTGSAASATSRSPERSPMTLRRRCRMTSRRRAGSNSCGASRRSRRAASSAKSAAASRSSSTKSEPPWRRGAARATRRRSTARSMWRAAARCGWARWPPSRSNARTNTTCTAPRWGSRARNGPGSDQALNLAR